MRILLCVLLLLCSSFVNGETIDDFIYKAETFRHEQNLDNAIELMKEAVKIYPDKPETYSFLGYYLGIQSFYEQDNHLFDASSELLNSAIMADPLNPIIRFHRGVTFIRCGMFTEHYEQGIYDLKLFLNLYPSQSDKLSYEFVLEAHGYLADAYIKCKNSHQAILAWEKIIALSPDSPQAVKAEQKITDIEFGRSYITASVCNIGPGYIANLKDQLKRDPNDVNTMVELSEVYFHLEKYEAAQKLCQKALELDAVNDRAIKLSVMAALKDGDSTLHKNSGHCNDVLNKLDYALKDAPSDKELRLVRGMLLAETSHNKKRLQQAFKDLNYILDNIAPECLKKQALYWLEITHQKMLITSWDDNSLISTVARDAKISRTGVQL